MHGALGAMGDDKLTITQRALALLRVRIGGTIRGDKLYPIGPALTALRPLEPACELQRAWHAVQVSAQQEGKVTEAIGALKFDTFCPREPYRIRVNAHRHRTGFRPLLPGYAFIGFDARNESWEQITELKGVIKVFMVDEQPVPIADTVITRLRQIETERSGGRCRKAIPAALAVGALVRVLEPFAFAGLFGFIVTLDTDKGMVCVEMEIFRRPTPIWLGPDQVEVV